MASDVVEGRLAAARWVRVVSDHVTLTKPRIVAMLLLTAYGAMVLATPGWPRPGLVLATLSGLFLPARGAHAVNMWYDRDIDPVMSRTAKRPIPQGRVKPTAALVQGIGMEIASIGLLATAVDPSAAVWSTVGFLVYVGVYTIGLKRRTPLNIVIGGAAGGFPPLVGWAAVAHHLAGPAWLLFAMIGLWTPPHFWSLALFRLDDYRSARVPMMPLVRGERVTKRQSAVYAALLVGASIALAWTRVVSARYLFIVVPLDLLFLGTTLRMGQERLPAVRWAKRTFAASLLYMTALVAAWVIGARW